MAFYSYLNSISVFINRFTRWFFLPLKRSGRLVSFVYFAAVFEAYLGKACIGTPLGTTPQCLVFDVYVFALLGSIFGKTMRYAIGIFVFLLLTIEQFLMRAYECNINASMVGLVLQTDARESSEFLSETVSSPALWTSLLVNLAIAGVAAFLLPALWKKVSDFLSPYLLKHRYRKYIKYAGLALSLSAIVFICDFGICQQKYYRRIFEMSQAQTIQESEAVKSIISSSPWMRLGYAYALQRISSLEYASLDKTLSETTVTGCDSKSPIILLVIGESYNKYFSPLYNPDALPATPRLCNLAKNGELLVFDDVIAYANLTSKVFRSLFSLGQPEQGGENLKNWSEYPTFPAVFKKAGYTVCFFSNQFVQNETQGDHFDQLGGQLFNYGNLSANQFTIRNTQKKKMDGDFCKLLPSVDTLLALGKPLLMIVHLLGQHLSYEHRSPGGVNNPYPFTMSDIKPCPGGKKGQVQRMCYANAVHYNDSVVAEVFKIFAPYETIGIYLSDHGEEVYDFRDFHGRGHADKQSPMAVKYQYEVPFFVYLSPKYREKHPDMAQQISEVRHLPFITCDLSHTLLYLAGITCPEYDESRSLFSPNYNAKRKRYILGQTDYDALMENSSSISVP